MTIFNQIYLKENSSVSANQEIAILYLQAKNNEENVPGLAEWLNNKKFTGRLKNYKYNSVLKNYLSMKNRKPDELILRRGPNLSIPIDIQNAIYYVMEKYYNHTGEEIDDIQMNVVFSELKANKVSKSTWNILKKKRKIYL